MAVQTSFATRSAVVVAVGEDKNVFWSGAYLILGNYP